MHEGRRHVAHRLFSGQRLKHRGGLVLAAGLLQERGQGDPQPAEPLFRRLAVERRPVNIEGIFHIPGPGAQQAQPPRGIVHIL